MRYRLFLLFVFQFLTLTLSSAHAANFESTVSMDYRFASSGISAVTQQVTLTNLQSKIYAPSYQLKFSGELPKNFSASDTGGPLKTTTVSEGSDTYLITIEFPTPLVGKDQTRVFTIRYEGQPAVKKGQIWEINLPRISHDFRLIVPSSFGDPAYISPPPSSSIRESVDNVYLFSPSVADSVGISAAFGNFQVFDFRLSYPLTNTRSEPILTEIALPPDTAYQKVFYDSLNPAPQNVLADADGNWLAQYLLTAGQELKVTASGQVHLLAEPGAVSDPPTDLSVYTQPSDYWIVSDDRIADLVKKHRTPRDIYDYVVKLLDYDYSEIGPAASRRTSSAILDDPSKSRCQDFTDLFITLAHAAGIPARELNGYAYTTDSRLRPLSLQQDILHAWPEYWDSQSGAWISVDPTWENTTGGLDYFSKFDFNHFAFTIHGVDASYPVAAGLYDTGSSSRDVEITLSKFREYLPPSLSISWTPPFQILPLPIFFSDLRISNPSGQSVNHPRLLLKPENLNISPVPPSDLGVMPPFSSQTYPLSLFSSYIPDISPKSLLVSAGSAGVTYNIPARLLLGWYVAFIIFTAVSLIFVALIAYRTWSLFLQRRRRQNPLRRQSQKP